MKKVISVVLIALMLLLTVSTSVSASIVPQKKESYCDICDEVSYYWYLPSYSSYYPVPCTEEHSVILDCGHKKILREAIEHHFQGHFFSGSEYISYECVRCGEWYSEKLSDHKCEDFWYPTDSEPSCESQGCIGEKICNGCGTSYDATYIPALGHNFKSSNNDSVAPTCTEDGHKSSFNCTRCKYVEEGEVIPALGHDMGSHDTPATCKEEGRKGGNYCGREGCDYVVEEPTIIPPTGIHTEEVIKGIIPNCYKEGRSDGKRCSVCREVLVEQKTLPPTHTEITIKGVAPTCTEKGMTDGKYCSACKTVVVPRTEIEPNPDNHTPKTIGKKSATYFAKGHTGKKVCKDCGEVISKGKATPILKLKTPTAKYTGGKKKLTVKYTKVKDATGFEVKYKIGKKSITKTYTTKKSATKTIKNLKKGTYKVQVRSFVKSGSKISYSNWSKAKSVKVK